MTIVRFENCFQKQATKLFLQLMYGSLYFLSLKDTGLKLWKSMIFDLAVEKKL
jgi:hypothetical protein